MIRFRCAHCAAGRLPQPRGAISGHPIEALELRRLLSSGALDPSFGDGGVTDVVVDRAVPSAVGLQPAGGVLVAGTDLTDFTVLLLGADAPPGPACRCRGRVTPDPPG